MLGCPPESATHAQAVRCAGTVITGTATGTPPGMTDVHRRPDPAGARLGSALEGTAQRLERARALDRPANMLAAAGERLIPAGGIRDLLAGVPIGHPLHPVLVAGPIGSWAAASWLDLTGRPRAARRLVALGVCTAAPTALSGLTDWLSTDRAERRVGLVHAVLNTTAVLVYTASWQARRRGRHVRGAVLSVVGLGVTATAGWLGGHLTYACGVGVDTTAFQAYPADWTDVADLDDVPQCGALGADAGGVPVLLARQNGTVVALAGRCTHRGGPLADGSVDDGCISCPWHGSSFDLATGAVRHGPATRPQPVLSARVHDGRIQVRREDEPRALRSNPIGP